MNVIDSSGWLEFFTNGPNASFFRLAISQTSDLLVPTISLYEVFKRVLRERGESDALRAVAIRQEGRIIQLDARLALDAAKISADLKLPMADSINLATARRYKATLWTQDIDFQNVPDVKYTQK